ncbi:MAG TPA: sigma-54 dependent transcriptional regulator, partial [Pirellulales bacterium]
GPSQLIGTSRVMDDVRKLIARVAPTDSTVLVRGETGTGKELAARSIHDQSQRADKPFVAINCGALPEALIESELFGHRKGAFTGADQHRVGLFEVADGGTLFLDEIGELPRGLQAKLLRFMESGEIRRVGDNENFVVDVRVVCATHRDLEKMVADGDFREDLLFRMNTFEVVLPSLRQRKEDIPLLARHLLRRFRPHLQANDEAFSPEAVRMLQEYAWSGNVRELANVIEHAGILCDGLPIRPEHLPARKFELRRYAPPAPDAAPIAASIAPAASSIAPSVMPAPLAAAPASSATASSHGAHGSLAGPHFTLTGTATLRDIELQVIQQVLDRCHGNKPKAADELGISLKTLYNKLNQIAEAEKAG